MLWDQTLPALAGYFAALLYNQNNVAAEASPVTTALEIEVAAELCKMVGYRSSKKRTPWGHITCGGSIANIEALWSARNTKLYPAALYAALRLDSDLGCLDGIEVVPTGPDRKPKRLVDCDWWELLNLSADVILNLPDQLTEEAKQLMLNKDFLQRIDRYTVQYLGMTAFADQLDDLLEAGGAFRRAVAGMKIVGAATAHYSLLKAATLLGLGGGAFHRVKVQRNARVDTEHLSACIREFSAARVPVLTVVAIMGTTEESAVDDLTAVLNLRDELRGEGTDFFVHADGAWGGYFASLLHKPEQGSAGDRQLNTHRSTVVSTGVTGDQLAALVARAQLAQGAGSNRHFVHTVETGLNEYTERQLLRLRDADTITIDPHKSGFAPYPAGGLLYRDRRMPEMIQITAPVVYHDGKAPTVGVFGVEGSKPGAAAAGVHFSHKIMSLDQGGYGRILGRCNFNAKLAFAELVALKSDHFTVAVLTDLTADELAVVRSWAGLSNAELWDRLGKHPEEMKIFRRTGPDLNIITYALNPILPGGANTDPKETNTFNNAIFEKLSVQRIGDPVPELYVTSSTLDAEHSEAPIRYLRTQLGVRQDSQLAMNFLITTIMNPFLSDTDNGTRNMVPEVIGHLSRAAEEVARELYDPNNHPPKSSNHATPDRSRHKISADADGIAPGIA
nr:pyridoxal-dependent decarboxylase [Lewinella sp. JB7]